MYIKDGDEAMFLTNFNIVPKTSIEKIRIMRNGRDWIDDTNVFPGETINVRIEGESLGKSKLTFEGLIVLDNDSVIHSNDFVDWNV